MVCLVHDNENGVLSLQPPCQVLQILADAVFSGNQQSVVRPDSDGAAMAGGPGNNAIAKRGNSRHVRLAGIALEGIGGLVEKHLAVGEPKDLESLSNGVFQEPNRGCERLPSSCRQDDECAERGELIDAVKTRHGFRLMLVKVRCRGVMSDQNRPGRGNGKRFLRQ